jgi:hypothetical protein
MTDIKTPKMLDSILNKGFQSLFTSSADARALCGLWVGGLRYIKNGSGHRTLCKI